MTEKTSNDEFHDSSPESSQPREPDDLIFERFPGEFYFTVGERIADSLAPFTGKYASRKLLTASDIYAREIHYDDKLFLARLAADVEIVFDKTDDLIESEWEMVLVWESGLSPMMGEQVHFSDGVLVFGSALGRDDRLMAEWLPRRWELGGDSRPVLLGFFPAGLRLRHIVAWLDYAGAVIQGRPHSRSHNEASVAPTIGESKDRELVEEHAFMLLAHLDAMQLIKNNQSPKPVRGLSPIQSINWIREYVEKWHVDNRNLPYSDEDSAPVGKVELTVAGSELVLNEPDKKSIFSEKKPRIYNCEEIAYQQFFMALSIKNETEACSYEDLKDNEAYDILTRAHPDLVLPIRETWKKYVRNARKAYETNKNTPKSGRSFGPSVVRQHDV